jgi:hypothetical protein
MYYIHINRNVIQRNAKNGASEPVVRFQKGKYGKAEYAYEVKFSEGTVRYSPDEPILPCGAKLVIETPNRPEVIS